MMTIGLSKVTVVMPPHLVYRRCELSKKLWIETQY